MALPLLRMIVEGLNAYNPHIIPVILPDSKMIDQHSDIVHVQQPAH